MDQVMGEHEQLIGTTRFQLLALICLSSSLNSEMTKLREDIYVNAENISFVIPRCEYETFSNIISLLRASLVSQLSIVGQ
jgi:hypothetical protein